MGAVTCTLLIFGEYFFVNFPRQDIYWRELLSSRHLMGGATLVKTFQKLDALVKAFSVGDALVKTFLEGDALVKTFIGGRCSR